MILIVFKKVTTDILYSDIDPAAGFYNTVDSFYVAYQYKKGNTWEYKLAGFDENGKLSSTYLIDNTSNLNPEDSVSYNYYQSNDSKVLGCVKTIINKRYNALKFELTFLNKGNLYRDHFILSFDSMHEKFADILIDSNKNITFLKTSNTDTGFSVSIIKKEFAADHFSIANKKLVTGNLRDGTCHFFNQHNTYTIYGVWKNELKDSVTINQQHTTGFYSWKTDNALTDMPGDTVFYYGKEIISSIDHYATNYSNNNLFGIETDQSLIPGPPALPKYRILSFQGIGDNHTGYNNYMEPNLPADSVPSHYKAGFTVVSLNNKNKIEWSNELKNDPDSILLTDLLYNKISTGKKGIHILRSGTVKKMTNTITHVMITYAGGYQKLNMVVWNNKYNYVVSSAVETNDGALIIPCIKSDKLIFARMVLE